MNRQTTVITPEALRAQEDCCARIAAYWRSRGRVPRAFVDTYGCQQNEADSERIRGILAACGYAPADEAEGADCVVINTCAVREHAETRVFGNVGALVHTKQRHPGQKIFLCGCMMAEPSSAEKMKNSYRHVDGIFSPHHLWRFPELLETALRTGRRVFATEDSAGSIAEGIPVARANTLKAWVSVMYGCNNFCSYCIVPYVRGREISRDPRSVLDEIGLLEDKGVREITLLGQNVNSYRWEKDGRTVDFPALLRLVAERVKSIRWVRFLSSHPKDLSAEVVSAMRDHPVLCRHVHLCVQHGSDRILQAMNRRYTATRYLELVDMLRSELPDVSLSTDILIGFPGETEEDVEETLELMRRVKFAYSYMYHYNPREGTAAYALPNRVPDAVKKARLARVIDLQQEITKDLMRSRVGSVQTVLVDGFAKRDSSELLGRTYRDEMVVFPGDPSLVGGFAELTVSSLRGTTFRAKGAVPCAGA